jgi:hypothetical protein
MYACRSFLSIVLAGYPPNIWGIPAQKRTKQKNVDKNCKINSNKEL